MGTAATSPNPSDKRVQVNLADPRIRAVEFYQDGAVKRVEFIDAQPVTVEDLRPALRTARWGHIMFAGLRPPRVNRAMAREQVQNWQGQWFKPKSKGK